MNVDEFNSITGARVLENQVLELRFGDGYVGRLDMTPALWGPVFEPLKCQEFFRQFRIDDDTIRWPNDADFCPDVLRFWCESGGVRSQEVTDAYFTRSRVERTAS